jgi:hypothetical protein
MGNLHQVRISIEQIREERFPVAPFGLVVAVVLTELPIFPFSFAESTVGGLRTGAVDNPVESAAVDPYTPALGTIVDFDALALSHL